MFKKGYKMTQDHKIKIGKANSARLEDKIFGQLLVLKRHGKTTWQNTTWLSRCSCGKETIVQEGNLTSGHTKSCGCLFRCWRNQDGSGVF